MKQSRFENHIELSGVANISKTRLDLVKNRSHLETKVPTVLLWCVSTPDDNEMHLAYVSAIARGSNPAVPWQLQQKLEPPPTSYSTTPTHPSSPLHDKVQHNPSSPPANPLPDSTVAFECEKPLMCGSGRGVISVSGGLMLSYGLEPDWLSKCITKRDFGDGVERQLEMVWTSMGANHFWRLTFFEMLSFVFCKR